VVVSYLALIADSGDTWLRISAPVQLALDREFRHHQGDGIGTNLYPAYLPRLVSEPLVPNRSTGRGDAGIHDQEDAPVPSSATK
jgi:hypothetical protein